MFFVLSGFLISTLLLNEMRERGRINLVAFWSRRVRRLLPALLVLMLVVAVVTGLNATFSERHSVRGDLLATTTYVANWRFISTSRYFQNTGTDSPLQHTWSLGIEEQFYLLWPLLLAILILVTKRPRPTVAIPAVLGAMASAVVLAALWAPRAVDRAYLGTDARIVEPLIGAVAAVIVADPRGRAAFERVGTWLAAAGAAGVTLFLVLIRSDTSFYYYGGAVGVSICTAILVASLWVGRGGPLGRFLAWTPVAFLGVISYGVYLWHWPLVLWLGTRNARGLDALVRGVLAVGLTIGVATASFFLVERPIRRGWGQERHRARIAHARPVIVLALVPLAMVSVIGVSLAATRVPPPGPGTPIVMLTGDSVPLHLEIAMERLAEKHGWRIVSAARGACSVTGERELAPLPSNDLVNVESNCPQVVTAQNSLIREFDPDVVVWWDRWSLSNFLTAGGERVYTGTTRFWDLRQATLRNAVRRLTSRGAKILFVATEPPNTAAQELCDVGQCPPWWRFLIDHYDDITKRWNGILSEFASAHPSETAFASVTDVICKTDVAPCEDSIEGAPARPDAMHYAAAGETKVVDVLEGFLAPLLDHAS
jgi:peptidoglycan/LPS O-acetylase OafA/YrhL